jgi:PBP4 family serine-type D-alanyl-D-alanine carboxypeptidase
MSFRRRVTRTFMNGCSSRQSVKITPLSSTRPTHIAQSLEDIIKEADPNVNIGISIQSLTSGKMLYEKNSDRHFVPCSTMKVVTLAAALHYLGPSYRFTTKLLSNETVKPHGVVDNLYLKGSGDPSLMDYELVLMAQELAQRGIKTISGDIVIDDFIFDDVLWGRGDMWDDRNKGYAAPVAGINVNYNRIQVKTVPSLIQSGNAVPVLWPKTNYVAIESIAKLLRTIQISPFSSNAIKIAANGRSHQTMASGAAIKSW